MLAEQQLGLDKVRVDKDKLIEKLQQNREAHAIEHAKALKTWNGLVLKRLGEALLLAEAGTEFRTDVLYTDRDVVEPADHLDQYDDTIALLRASKDEVIVLGATEFKMYWLDKWQWQGTNKMSFDNSTRAIQTRSY